MRKKTHGWNQIEKTIRREDVMLQKPVSIGDLMVLSALPPEELTQDLKEAMMDFYEPKSSSRRIAIGATERMVMERMSVPKKIKESLDYIVEVRPFNGHTVPADWVVEVKDRLRLAGIHAGLLSHLWQRQRPGDPSAVKNSKNVVAIIHLLPWQVQQNLPEFFGKQSIEFYSASLMVLMGQLGLGGINTHDASGSKAPSAADQFIENLVGVNQQGLKALIDAGAYSEEDMGMWGFKNALERGGIENVKEVWALWEAYELERVVIESRLQRSLNADREGSAVGLDSQESRPQNPKGFRI